MQDTTRPSPAPVAPNSPRRSRRLLAWVLAGTCLVLLAAGGALAWLGSESGLQWLAARTPLQLGTTEIAVQNVRGSAWSDVRIGRLQITTPTSTVTLHDAQLRWTPAALWQRTLHIQNLSVQQIDIVQTHASPASAPLQLPASLRLPVNLAIDRLAIGALRLGAPGVLRSYGALSGNLHDIQGSYHVQVDATTPWANAQLSVALGDSAPYPLKAELRATHVGLPTKAPASNTATLRASGSLRDVALTGALQMDVASAQLQARLTPFDATLLRSARLTSSALDPAAFDASLPHAALDVHLDLGPSSAQRLQGQLSVRNALPGPIDQHRLPLHSLQAALAADAQHATARNLVIDLGAGGRLRGTLDWTPPALQARLQAENINARALDGQLATTRLSGPIALDATAQQQSTHATLTQPGWDIRLDAQRTGDTLRINQLLLSALGGQLDARGTLSTTGTQPFDLRAKLRQFDPARFGAYPVATLNADVSAQGSVLGRSAKLALHVEPSVWRGHTFTGHARLAVDPQRLWDVDAALTLGNNSLSAQGAFGLPRDALQWTLKAPALAQIDPALQGNAQAQGQLRGGLQAPSGTVTLQADDLRWAKGLALHHLSAQSTLSTGGAPGAKVAANLSALLDRLAGTLTLDLDGLQWTHGAQSAQIGTLHAQARTTAGLNGQLHLATRIENLHVAGQTLDTASLQVDGTRARHTIMLDAQGRLQARNAANAPAATPAQAVPINLQLHAAGGWLGAQQGWRGQITTLNDTGRAALHLQAPAALQVAFSPLRLQVQRARLQLQAGLIDLASLDIAPGRVHTQGRLQTVDTADLLALAGIVPARMRDTLVLSGDWLIDAGEQVNGHLHLQRDSGDIALQVAPPPATRVGTVTFSPNCDATLGQAPTRGGFMPLGIGRLVLDITAKDNQVRAQGVVQTAMGTAQASGSTLLTRRGDLWGVAGDTPLQLAAGADMPSLAWAAPLIGFDYRAEGRLQLAVQGRGTFANPQFSGSLDGKDLSLAWPTQGVDLKNGVLRAHFTGDRLQLDQLELHGGSGLLTATGDARLQNGLPRATLELKADKLQLLNRPDRQLVLSGDAQARLADKVLDVTTNLTADRADIALPRNSGATQSSDVVIAGQTAAPAKPAAAMPRAVRFDGSFNLGTNFHLYGRGLDAMLTGSVRMRAENGATPTATGSIELVKGEYTAYGQQLQVTQGRINFAGPVDNPGLNITATRPNLPTGIEVGVTITGSARRPLVKLSSSPPMPDTEILSWLVLGQPLDQVGASDIALLQTAAAALLGPSDGLPLQTRLARAVGLDSISVQGAANTASATGTATNGSGLQGTIITLSKRLSSDTLVSFSRGLDGVSSIFTIQHQLTKRLSIQTQTGTGNAVDLFYTFEFH